jgi:hypothetical protein
MRDTRGAYLENGDFYRLYGGYLSEPRVRQVHDAVFTAVRLHRSFQRVIDLGCGKGNEFLHYGRPDFYLGVDLNADPVHEAECVIKRLDFRNIEALRSLIKEHRVTGAVSLFAAEITRSRDENHAFYEALFRDLGLNAMLLSGFYYKHAKHRELVREAGNLVSYQTSGTIERPDTAWFHETRIEIPCPSRLFGEDVIEVYRLLQGRGSYDAMVAGAFSGIAPEGYLASTRMAVGHDRNTGTASDDDRLLWR